MSKNLRNIVSIYKIDKEKISILSKHLSCVLKKRHLKDHAQRDLLDDYDTSQFKDKFKTLSFQELVSFIRKFNSYTRKRNGDQDLWDIEKGKSLITLYQRQESTLPWNDFFLDTYGADHDLVVKKNIKMSYVSFLSCKDNIYAITGGNGYHLIKNYIEFNLGIDIFCRIYSREEVEPKMLKSRSFTGSQLLTQSFYRNSHKLIYEDNFGKLYSEVVSSLARDRAGEIFKEVGLDLKQDITIEGKDSFKINKAITLKELKKVTSIINDILSEDENFSLNKIRRLSNRKKDEKVEIRKLEKELENILRNYLLGLDDHTVELMSNKHPVEFASAERYFLYQTGHSHYFKEMNAVNYNDFDKVIHEFKNVIDNFIIDENNVDDFLNQLLNIKIEYTLSEGREYKEKLGELIFVEFRRSTGDNETAFKMFDNWYLLQDSFKEVLIERYEDLVKSSVSNMITQKWDVNETEEEFILKLFSSEVWIPLHTVKVDNVELCDLLKFDDKNKKVYLVHVKKKFDAIVRDVVSQATLSTKMILEDRKGQGGGKIISKYIQSLKKKSKSEGNSQYSISLKDSLNKELIDKIKTALTKYEVVTCVAILDTNKKFRSLENEIGMFQSTIAKFELVNFSQTMRSANLKFKVIQLKKE